MYMYSSHFRRTGRNVRAGKNIRIKEDGFEDFDDYMSESGNTYFLKIYIGFDKQKIST